MLSRDGGHLKVEIGRRSGCAVCDAGQGCGAGLFGKLLNQKPIRLNLESSFEGKPGQAVTVGLPETLFLKWVWSLYGIPLLAGLGGAGLAMAMSIYLGLNGGWADLLVLAGALLVAWPALKFRNRTLKPEIGSKQLSIIDTSRPGAVCGGPGIQGMNEVNK